MDTAPQPVVLTERQTCVLWLLSVGRSREDVAQATGCTLSNVKGICQRIQTKLGAANTAHAVRIGLLEGHIGPYEDCGSLAAYRRHIKADEPTCPACKRGNRERAETEALLRGRPALGEPHVRLLRAMRAGYSNLQIRQTWNIPERTLTRLVTVTYGLLGVDHLAPAVRREAALREAQRRGLFGTVQPTRPASADQPVTLSETQVSILAQLSRGSSISEAAEALEMHAGTVATRLSEAYQRLGVAWMDKSERRPEALRRARAMGLLPEPVTA